jgi:hypothetical protein
MRMNPVRWLGLGFVVAIALAAVARSQQTILLPAKFTNPRAALDLQRDPPRVEKASIRLLTSDGKSNALLRVIFNKRDQRLAKAVRGFPLAGINENTMLRDDGEKGDEKAQDGVFSAIVDFDIKAASTEQSRRLKFGRDRKVPVFAGRNIIGSQPIRFIDPKRFKPGFEFNLRDLIVPLGLGVDASRELMIRDLSVVEDPTRTTEACTGAGNPDGPWTFKHLMTEMANQSLTGLSPMDFVRRWLRRWEVPQTVNDFSVATRPNIVSEVISTWPKLADGRLDLNKAPFRLLAIVNRVDLRANTVYGGGSAGEARFVFGVVKCATPGAPEQMLRFTTIFEYGIKQPSCSATKDWGQQWHALGTMTLGSPEYNTALENITRQFTEANADPSKLPNRSALNQLRTNELAIGPFPWELREFQPSPATGGNLEQVTVKQTPDISFNNTATVSNYMNANEAALLADRHVIPLEFPTGSPFLAGFAPTDGGMVWKGDPSIPSNGDARQKFSLATCNGCHAGETSTSFTHISPRPAGTQADLSRFLTGITMPDPVSTSPSREFNDLDRRKRDLETLVTSGCRFFGELFFQPLEFTH